MFTLNSISHITSHVTSNITSHSTSHITSHVTSHITLPHLMHWLKNFGLNHVSVTTPSLPSESIYPLLKSPHFAKDLCLLNYEIDGENPVHGNVKKNHLRV